MRDAFGFPAVVNEKAARVVAGGVALIAATALLTGWLWLSAVLAVGFALRVATGPRYSPLGQLATKVVAPRLGEPVPRPRAAEAVRPGRRPGLHPRRDGLPGRRAAGRDDRAARRAPRLRAARVGRRLLRRLLRLRPADEGRAWSPRRPARPAPTSPCASARPPPPEPLLRAWNTTCDRRVGAGACCEGSHACSSLHFAN